jgi:RNase P subunit RPR2
MGAAIKAQIYSLRYKFKEGCCKNCCTYLVISDEIGTATVDKGSGEEKTVEFNPVT